MDATNVFRRSISLNNAFSVPVAHSELKQISVILLFPETIARRRQGPREYKKTNRLVKLLLLSTTRVV